MEIYKYQYKNCAYCRPSAEHSLLWPITNTKWWVQSTYLHYNLDDILDEIIICQGAPSHETLNLIF